jgi:hypothetical protein
LPYLLDALSASNHRTQRDKKTQPNGNICAPHFSPRRTFTHEELDFGTGSHLLESSAFCVLIATEKLRA